jgi:uncharacterized protein with von Willebrand factor type A (vWA) domain
MRFVVDFIGALRDAGLPVSQAETLDALRAIKLLGLESRDRSKSVLALTLVKRQADQVIYDELFDLYFTSMKQVKEDTNETKAANCTEEEIVDPDQAQNQSLNEASTDGPQNEASSQLGKALLDNEDMSLAIAKLADAEKLSSIVMFTQKNGFAYKIMQGLGDRELSAEIHAETDSAEHQKLQSELTLARERLYDQVKDYVEQQYMLFAQRKGIKFREGYLKKMALGQLDHLDYKKMQDLVQQAARKLASQHGRRRLTRKRGMLDVRKTIAANAAFDGALFHTKWKATRVERPKIVAICDVSGSVSRIAHFLLLFIYSLQDVMPKVRSFIFASEMIEVTTLFEQEEIALALDEIMQRWGGMSTNYAKALVGFQSQALESIDKKTTVIMLGDARNNKGEGRADIWEKVFRRSKRVIWLNPERRNSWDTGDSIMSEYSPWCSTVEPCRNLQDIENVFNRLLKYS